MPKKVIKTMNTEVRKNQNYKATVKEKKEIVRNAKKYANGNISFWTRWSAINCKPTASQLKDLKNVR